MQSSILFLVFLLSVCFAQQYGGLNHYQTTDCSGTAYAYQSFPIGSCAFISSPIILALFNNTHYSITYYNTSDCSDTPNRVAYNSLSACNTAESGDGSSRATVSNTPYFPTDKPVYTFARFKSCSDLTMLSTYSYNPDYCVPEPDEGSSFKYFTCNATHAIIRSWASLDCTDRFIDDAYAFDNFANGCPSVGHTADYCSAFPPSPWVGSTSTTGAADSDGGSTTTDSSTTASPGSDDGESTTSESTSSSSSTTGSAGGSTTSPSSAPSPTPSSSPSSGPSPKPVGQTTNADGELTSASFVIYPCLLLLLLVMLAL